MFCVKCGMEIDDDSVFCTGCGARIGEPETVVNAPSGPDFLKEDEEPTMLLSDEELQEAFINEYGAESPEIGHPSDNSRDFFYNSDMAENTDDLMPFNEYSGSIDSAPHEDIRNKSFNDNSDTISFDAVEDEMYAPPLPEPYPEPEPYNEPQPYAPPYSEPYNNYQADNVPPPHPVQKRTAQRQEPQTVKIGAGRLVGAFLLSVFAIVFLLVFSLTLCIKLGMSGGIVRNNLTRMNDNTLLSSEYEGNELSNTIYGSLGFKNATGGMASESSFRNYMLRTDFVDYIGRSAGSYLSYIIDGRGGDPSITSEDFVYDFIKGNNRASIEEWGYSMTDNEYMLMAQNLESDGFSDDMSISEWGSAAGFSLRNLKFLFSFMTIAVFLIITALLFIWTAVAVGGHGKYITSYFGGILKTSGFVMIFIGAASVLAPALAYVFNQQAVFYILAYGLRTFALIALCTGAAELILGGIFSMVHKRMK
ncbi:MAG: zinc ribbon domain-containing protein [Ruminococcus flavefaciens]